LKNNITPTRLYTNLREECDPPPLTCATPLGVFVAALANMRKIEAFRIAERAGIDASCPAAAVTRDEYGDA